MTVGDADQYGMLQADWGDRYHICHQPHAAKPYQAFPRDDPGTVLEAATPRQLREMIRDHAARPAAPGSPS